MYKQILVPIDLNEKGLCDKALKHAIWQAKQSNAQLHLLNVLPGIHMSMVANYFPKGATQQMKQEVEAQLNAFANKHIAPKLVYHIHIAEGKPYSTIIDYSEKVGADLIIMPSHKRSRINKVVLGSVASKVVENSPINVLIIKPNG